MPKDHIIVFEDEHFTGFHPLSLSRPAFNILVGAKTNLERIKHHFADFEITTYCRPHLSKVFNSLEDEKIKAFFEDSTDKIVLINGRVVIRESDFDFIHELKNIDNCVSYLRDGTLLAAVLPKISIRRFREELSLLNHKNFTDTIIDISEKQQHVDVLTFSHIWEPVLKNQEILESDFNEYFKDSNHPKKIGDAFLYGRDEIYVDNGAVADAASVIDSRNGPVIIGRGVEIKPFTYVEGPAFIGDGCKLVGGKILNGCSLGAGCRVGGEVENTIFIGNSNKYHEGFIGHSYIGEWVNIGALTTNSDLANNYSEITIRQNGTNHKTGNMKIGSFIGDHSKFGIGMTFNTGLVIGFSSNLFGGSIILEKEIPSFAWGNDTIRRSVSPTTAIQTAEIVLNRRNFKMENSHRDMFEHIYDQSKKLREAWSKKKKY
jgi:UDP-N-acetylglucosamine diphosphorylase/glucosamine-1-phosphate N-acetyltransferase